MSEEVKEHSVYAIKFTMLNKKIEQLQRENKELEERWDNFKKFIHDNCLYDGDTLTYEELIDEVHRLEYEYNE